MGSRAMVVVAGGSSTRFGSDKLLTEVAGKPLLSHTIEAVSGSVDIVVVAVRHDIVEAIEDLGHDVVVTAGGASRTHSEQAGLAALGSEYDLIGIHDGARPLATATLVEELYRKADEDGGAVPVLAPDTPLIDRRTLKPMKGVVTVQTPQVFRGPDLIAAYAAAAQSEIVAHDTVEVVQTFGDLAIAMVEGEPQNIKVTYPADLALVRSVLRERART